MTTRKTAAIIVSRLMGPNVSLFAFLLTIVTSAHALPTTTLVWLTTLFLIGGGIPTIYFLFQHRRGRISDLDVTDRMERTPLFLVVVLAWTAALICSYLFDLPLIVKAGFTAGVITGLVFLGITQRWKISVHSGFWTALSLLLWIHYGPHYLWLLLGLVPIFWARLSLEKHTALQLLAGAGVAGTLLVLVFSFFDLLPLRIFH